MISRRYIFESTNKVYKFQLYNNINIMDIKNETIVKLMRKMYILQIKARISQKRLAELLGITVRDPRFRDLISILRAGEMMVEHETFEQIKLIELRYSLIEGYIRVNSEDFAEWGKFIEISRPYSFNY